MSTAAPRLEALEPLELLSQRSRRLADLVEAISKRRDVVRRRAKLLLLLLELRCPASGRPRRPWYVPGAVARLGPSGIWRAWRHRWGERPPSETTIRAHLGMLERHLALIRSPGDRLPVLFDDEHPERLPRHPDTIHLLEEDREAEWWAGEGRRLLEANPTAKLSPTTWRRLFRDWRERASSRQLSLPFPMVPSPAPGPSTPEIPAARASRELAQAAVASPGAAGILSALDRVGAELRGPNRRRLARDLPRLRCSCALLAVALKRQADGSEERRRVRRRAGWLARAFDHATPAELRSALEWAARSVGISIPKPGSDRCRPRRNAGPGRPRHGPSPGRGPSSRASGSPLPFPELCTTAPGTDLSAG